jgi:phosphatidylinositol glycan class T
MQKGLATLLNSAYIHNTNYHSIGIHFRSVCRNTKCTKLSLELRQTVSLVYDTVTFDTPVSMLFELPFNLCK